MNGDLRTTKEALKGMLGAPDVIVLDVRSEKAWNASDAKIQGAIREIPAEVASWSEKYSKDQTLVLYCA